MTLLNAPSKLLLSLALLVSQVEAQTKPGAPPDSALFKTVASLDASLFKAYNTCDLATFGSFFADDVEFYHDKGGVTSGRPRLVESIQNNICGKTRRELVPGTLEVYPMEGYGALQTGSHLFCELNSKKCDGIAKYVHLWQNKDGRWQITRVISYDHKPNQ